MKANHTGQRAFLFLQGPHGPFFATLGCMLQAAGCNVWRIGFNAGDQFFWRARDCYLPYRDKPDAWPGYFERICQQKEITDVVLYGDTRPIHAQAIAVARKSGLRIHVFEEGYLRPYWVSYEREGSNGHSRLMQTSITDMQAMLALSDVEAPMPPSHWGDMRQHVFYGALYHWFILFLNRRYRHFQPHRALPVTQEFKLHVKRLLLMPTHALARRLATRRIKNGGFPFHLALLQLEHDSSFQMHSPFDCMDDFLTEVIAGFSKGAPRHHHLVIKAHPLEDGRAPIRKTLHHLAHRYGVTGRVHYVRGGKLAELLNEATTAVTVNSTAGQQVLWRGIPLKVYGTAVYDKPELISDQPLAEFFAAPVKPDNRAYKAYRRYLLETSQVPGGFYARSSRRQLLRHVVDMMLSPHDPYDALNHGTAAPRQQLSAVQ